MPFDNGGFEEAGARAGEPRAWRIRSAVRSIEVAAFGSPPFGHEAFEWLTLRRSLSVTDVVRAMFGTARAEAFSSWAIGSALSFSDVTSAAAVFDAQRVERFAPGWSNEVFMHTWNAVSAASATFGGPAEVFHPGWPGTAPRFEVWSDVVATAAAFDGDITERFGASWPFVS